jgi:2-polyprenyl-6-methoxyphenol hydroxylase-like FAD-dependent oxidoreductase
MRVLVVGAGIGGLSATLALQRSGHEVTVLERAERLEAAGAGITLFANAMDALGKLGVAEAVAAHGAAPRRGAILTSRGRVLSDVPADLLAGGVSVHRADLQNTLAAAAGELRLGVDVSSVTQEGEEAVALTADGTEYRGDLLIGADGLRSIVRDEVSPARPRYAGYTSWRGVSPIGIEPGRMTESWGVGVRFGLVDVGGGRTYWFATKNAREGEAEESGGPRAEIARRFDRWHTPIAAVVDANDEGAILRNDVYYLKPLRHWSKGRLVLLGDAAHATTPSVGQGAAQAIEDAVVLGDRLDHSHDLPAALEEYESLRRPRTRRVLKLSLRTDRFAQMRGAARCRLRNAAVRRTPKRGQRRRLADLIEHRV